MLKFQNLKLATTKNYLAFCCSVRISQLRTHGRRVYIPRVVDVGRDGDDDDKKSYLFQIPHTHFCMNNLNQVSPLHCSVLQSCWWQRWQKTPGLHFFQTDLTTYICTDELEEANPVPWKYLQRWQLFLGLICFNPTITLNYVLQNWNKWVQSGLKESNGGVGVTSLKSPIAMNYAVDDLKNITASPKSCSSDDIPLSWWG